MVEVDGVCFEHVVAIHCSGVDVLVEFAGVEQGVVKVADGENMASVAGGRRLRPLRIRC